MHAAPISIPTPSQLQEAALLVGSTAEGAVFAPAKPMTQVKPFDPANSTRKGGHGVSNWQIGRAAEVRGVKVKEFDRKDRWTAWRVRAKNVKEKKIAKAAKKTKKSKGRKSSKAVVL